MRLFKTATGADARVRACLDWLHSNTIALCAALALFGATAPSGAAPVTFDFTGTVTQIPVLDPVDPFGGTIVVGSAISGSYTFDSLTLDSIPLDPQTASYQRTGPPYGATATIGGNTFSTNDSLTINVANLIVSNIDQYGVLACSPNQASCMTGALTIELFFQDNQGTTFVTDTQPLVPPPLANFEIRDFHLYQNTFDSTGALIAQVQIDGEITSLTLHTPDGGGLIAEPGTLLLVGLGLGALAALRRRRSRGS